MIDLHFHCLPFIDDGPDEWDEAVELCRRAGEEGTEAIVATPHVLRDPWINDDPLARDEMVMKLNTLLGGRPSILPGCEFFFSSDALELWEKKDHSPLTGLNRNGYLLVEFPSVLVPSTAETVFHEFVVQGVHPVIAHPERNLVFVQQPEKLERLIGLGALVQITAGSFLGEFGPRALEAAESFLDRGLVHIVASDAHNLTKRPPRLRAAHDHIAHHWGDDVAERLCVTNPREICAG